MKLTAAQRNELKRLVTWRMPESWARAGFPGFPSHSLDMRSVGSLANRGLAESILHRYQLPGETEQRVVLCYRATDAGRAAHMDEVGEVK